MVKGSRQQQPSNRLFQDEGWVDHLENEIEANLRDDLEILLKNSEPDRRIRSSLEQIRTLVRNSDEVVLPESGHFYQNMHDRIMAQVETMPTPSASVHRSSWNIKALRRNRWSRRAGPVGVMMVLAVMSWLGVRSVDSGQENQSAPAQVAAAQGTNKSVPVSNERSLELELAVVSGTESGAFAESVTDSVLTHETQDDLLLAAVDRRLQDLSQAEAEAVLSGLMAN